MASGNGGGVYDEGRSDGTAIFTQNSGTVTGNEGTNDGGGVYVDYGGFTMEDGTISGNTAQNGGGVYIYSGTFKISDGTITGNTAAGTSKNGVYGTFTQTGGTVQSD